MITRIEAVNYKCLRTVSQLLSRFHVITGPNGAGKSTFLEVPRLLAAFAQDGLEALWDTARAGTLEEILFRGQGRSFQLAIQAEPPAELLGADAKPRFLRYELEIGWGTSESRGSPPQILTENLWLLPANFYAPRQALVLDEAQFPSRSRPTRRIIRRGKQLAPPKDWYRIASKAGKSAYFRAESSRWNLQIRNPTQRSALSTLPEDEERFPLANWFKTELVRKVQKIMLRSEAMSSPSSPLKDRRFAPDGSNLPQVVQALKGQSPRWLGWIEHLHTVLPIRDVAVHERPEDRQFYLKVIYDSGLEVPAWHLSDGTLRLLALTALAFSQSGDGISLIEEPENGIHPQAIEGVFQALSGVREGQVLLATHSPVVVAQATPAQLLCFGMSDRGETDIISGDLHPRLKDWKGEVQLSQLYAAGILS